MKKLLIRFLPGVAYIVVVVICLLTHVRLIEGQLQRNMATLETLLLVIPAIVFLWLYIRMQQKSFPKPPKTELGDVGVKVFTCYEQLKEKGEKYGLSQRESEIAWMLYKGYTNRQIAEELFIAESTVKKHATHIYEKLQVAGRKEFKKKIVE